MKKLFRSFTFKHYLSKYRFYRRWYGGRWEKHFIDICGCYIWLDMKRPNVWPEYRQPCSVWLEELEDYEDA